MWEAEKLKSLLQGVGVVTVIVLPASGAYQWVVIKVASVLATLPAAPGTS